MLEFGLPRGVWRPLWELYVRVGLPGGGRARLARLARASAASSARASAASGAQWPEPRLLDAWREAGIADVARAAAERRRRDRRLGDARVTAARPRPAFYALRPGGWRDYVTLLHPPYTLWHLSYVAVGAALAPRMDWALLGWTTLAFALAMGVGAHALDELHGRPLQTRIPSRMLVALAVVSISAACAIGIAVAVSRTLWLLVFVAVGRVPRRRVQPRAVRRRVPRRASGSPAAWGAFPVLTAYFASARTLHGAAFAAAGYAFAASWAQRRLSTPVRLVRRRVVAVEGTMQLDDGTTLPVDADALAAAPEAALKALVGGDACSSPSRCSCSAPGSSTLRTVALTTIADLIFAGGVVLAALALAGAAFRRGFRVLARGCVRRSRPRPPSGSGSRSPCATTGRSPSRRAG